MAPREAGIGIENYGGAFVIFNENSKEYGGLKPHEEGFMVKEITPTRLKA
jgi:hypothetical protein